MYKGRRRGLVCFGEHSLMLPTSKGGRVKITRGLGLDDVHTGEQQKASQELRDMLKLYLYSNSPTWVGNLDEGQEEQRITQTSHL